MTNYNYYCVFAQIPDNRLLRQKWDKYFWADLCVQIDRYNYIHVKF